MASNIGIALTGGRDGGGRPPDPRTDGPRFGASVKPAWLAATNSLMRVVVSQVSALLLARYRESHQSVLRRASS